MMKNITTKNFNEILSTIQNSKQKALQQVNSTLIELYWNIGKYISTKTIKENGGKSVVKELANFIEQKEPTLKGFSDKNLWKMKQFYETYHKNEKLSAVLRELPQNTCSLSPTVISEYETNLIPKKVLQQKLNEFYEMCEDKAEVK